MSLAAASTPWTCLSVSAICFTAGVTPADAAAGAICPPWACEWALSAGRTALEAARQAMLNVMATGRIKSRIGRLLGLVGDAFEVAVTGGRFGNWLHEML